LLAQRLDRHLFEIIVVDDGRDEVTRNVVEALARGRAHAEPAMRCLRTPKGRGPAVARNVGWRAAQGPLIAFTEEDTVPDPEWLNNGLQAMSRHTEWSALSGRVSTPRLDHSRRPLDPERMTRSKESTDFLTANAFVRRDALAALDGFDERFTCAWREDADLHFRLLRDVGPVGQCAGAVVLQSAGREERWGSCLRRQKNTFFDALLYKKHPQLYRQRIRPVPPWNHYLIVAATLSVPWFVASDHVEIAMAMLGFAVSLVLRLTGERLRQTSGDPSKVAPTLLTSALIPFLSVYWRLRGALRFRVLFL
jgi:GT2 family glycosyltransferase